MSQVNLYKVYDIWNCRMYIFLNKKDISKFLTSFDLDDIKLGRFETIKLSFDKKNNYFSE